jgi:menaquinol-cytochrome c reductase iron-sulfur subunit
MNHDDARGGDPDEGRRGFLKVGIGVLGAGVGAAVLGPVAGLAMHPLRESTTSGSDDFIVAGSRGTFGEEPTRVDLYSDRVDAWNRVINVKVGSAWVLERGGELVALSTVCPHLGCGLDYQATESKFYCACHKSYFTLDGAVENGPSPRAMDALEVQVEEKLVSIRYQRFKQGIEGKEPIG